MSLLKGIKSDTKEALASLWLNKDFQKLVKVLRLNQQNYAKLCLTQLDWEAVKELQWKAAAFSLVVKTVEECHKELSNQ